MVRKAKLAVCTINQWAVDFHGNCERIIRSIKAAHAEGSTYRLGSELDIPSYGCEDHFNENDTELHSWQVLAELLKLEESKDMLCDVGMPVMYGSARYNCRVIFLYKRILLIRPKIICANDGNYRELRWFTPWFRRKAVENFTLPECIQEITGQFTVPFGDAIIQTRDTRIGVEMCEELWGVKSPHIAQSLAGVEIFTNSSGSHFNIQKLNSRLELVKSATQKAGGVYMYSNQVGCDGSRLYFDGTSMIAVNGEVVLQGKQFTLQDVVVNVALVDLDEVSSFRGASTTNRIESSREDPYPTIMVNDFSICSNTKIDLKLIPNPVIEWRALQMEEEVALAPACWLWDYLRRSGQGGFFLPLSGGVDSSAVACIVYSMCRQVCEEVTAGNEKVLSDVRNIVDDENFYPSTPEALCNEILTTCYMATENSSAMTRKRSHDLAHRICSNHLEISIDTVVNAVVMVFTAVTGFIPKFKARGGTRRENLALQNIQARIRMVLAYVFAQLMQWVRGRQGGLLVLGTSNVDEALRGYFTKYDCSSADLNPIGGISKTDLKLFIIYAMNKFKIDALREIVEATPTAELEPLEKGEIAQSDENDMGMTYEELSVFGRMRRIAKCGPYSMFMKLVGLWRGTCSPTVVAQKVKHFFVSHSINRHKMTTLTPSMHAENYSPDDNRFDLRPFLYNKNWTWQFREIDNQVATSDQE